MRRIDMQDTTRISNTRYLIIGSSHAGIAALEAIRLLDESGSITMVTREDSMPYSPTILPYVISGEMAPELIHLRDQSYFDQLSINFRSGLAVTGINLDEKWVELESGEKINYEKLLLTTGADAAIPAFPGIESVPYQVVRTLDDALKLRDSIQTAKSAIVIGAGLIAMHTAENLAQSGLQATLIVRRQVSLFAYFDGAAARMIEHIFSDHGVTLATGSGVSEISAANGGCQVSLESGKVISAGVRPRISYLDGSNIEVDRGVLVNEKMRTSAQDVWAAGDVAQAPGFFDAGKTVNATLPNASVQGRIAGMDMVKDPALKPYLGSSGLNTFNFFGHHGFSLGLATVTESTDEIEVNTVYLPSSQCYQKLVFKNNRLVGVSAINAKLDPGILRELIQRQVDLTEVKERFASAPLETGRLLMTKLWR
jgi:phenylglyoxylate dehydrogenase epsilon subunit